VGVFLRLESINVSNRRFCAKCAKGVPSAWHTITIERDTCSGYFWGVCQVCHRITNIINCNYIYILHRGNGWHTWHTSLLLLCFFCFQSSDGTLGPVPSFISSPSQESLVCFRGFIPSVLSFFVA